MAGADVVIGGVDKSGNPYFKDRHAVANQLPEIDDSQDWTLLTAWERGAQTFLSFSRPFDTCDTAHDLPITDDLTTVIWAYGEVDDELQYHFQNRGVYNVYLLDPDLVPRGIDEEHRKEHPTENDLLDTNVFRITTHIRVPRQDTLYWCTFHRAPTRTKHHIVGFNPAFPSETDRRHVHHYLLHRCHAPPGVDPTAFFEGATKTGGTACYILDAPQTLPVQYCREAIHSWGVGGRAIFFPEHVGLPMSESGNEYYMFQVHYDNPNNQTNLNITTTLELHYTRDLREYDAGMLQGGDLIPGSTSIVIPPNSINHAIFGHCAPGCTEKMFPENGINLFAVFLHTHISGRGVRFYHFRGDRELPWVSYDDNYNFNYQQFRILRQERRVLNGDRLVFRCVYDTTNRNGSVVTGGFSTREEMCTALIYYYSKSPGYALCRSEIRSEEYWNFLGIRNVTWDESRIKMIVTSPPQYSGLTVEEYANNFINWDIKKREDLQMHHKRQPQVSVCPRLTLDNVLLNQGRPQQYLGKGRFPTWTASKRLTATSSQVLVDDDSEFESELPSDIQRYTPPPQCTRD